MGADNRMSPLEASRRVAQPMRSSREISTQASSQTLLPQDDWKKMTDLAEKKRAQNRIAQRNYRRNVKRRIEELEQQVATQAELLALPNEATKPWPVVTSSFETKAATAQAVRDNGPAQDRQKSSIAPVSLEREDIDVSERCHVTHSADPALCAYQVQGMTVAQDGHVEGSMELQPLAASRSRGKEAKRSRSGENHQEYAYGKVPSGSPSTMHFADLEMGVFDSMTLLHASDGSYPSSIDRNQRQESTISWSNPEDSGSQSPSTPHTSIRLEPSPGASLEERLRYLMKCARQADFEDLDSVIMAYYTAKFDEGSVCSTAQRFSRKRTLPKLLEKLQSEARTWGLWEAQPYQDEILNSAEGLYLVEMREFSARQGEGFLAALSSSSRGDWNHMHRKLQDEVPNLWSLVTKLCLEVVHESGSQHQPRVVLMAVSMLLMTSKYPAGKIGSILQRMATDTPN